MPRSVEVQRLVQSLEDFRGRTKGKDIEGLPEGMSDTIEQILTQLTQPGKEPASPGRRATAQASGDTGTGVHFSKAAKGADTPSPGQRAAQGVQSEVRRAAEQVFAKARSEQ